MRCKFDYNSDLVYKFYANISIGNDSHSVSSYIQGTRVHFSVEDFSSLLHIPCDGPTVWPDCDDPTLNWASINQTLSGTDHITFKANVNVLTNRAKYLQHFVRICVVQKGGDRTRLTPQIALATYYLMTGVSFDVVHTIVHQISRSSAQWNPSIKKFPNLCFGHIIAYLLEKKYGIESTLPPDYFTFSFAPDTLVKLKTYEGAPRAPHRHQEREREQEHEQVQEQPHVQEQEREQEHHYDYHTDASMHDAAYHYAGQYLAHDEPPHSEQPRYEPPPRDAGYDRFIGVGEQIQSTLVGMQQQMDLMRKDFNQFGRNQDHLIRLQEEQTKATHDMQTVVEGLATRVHYVLDRANLPRAPRQGETVDIDSE